MITVKTKYLFDGRIKVTDDGVVYKLYHDGIMRKASTSNSGGENRYQRLTLSNRGETIYLYVHRLVAEAFIPNPHNLPVVNHLDGNTQNNKATNLEWCTHKSNILHAYNVLKRPRTRLCNRSVKELEAYYQERHLTKTTKQEPVIPHQKNGTN